LGEERLVLAQAALKKIGARAERGSPGGGAGSWKTAARRRFCRRRKQVERAFTMCGKKVSVVPFSVSTQEVGAGQFLLIGH
jgi:hypothetical protein